MPRTLRASHYSIIHTQVGLKVVTKRAEFWRIVAIATRRHYFYRSSSFRFTISWQLRMMIVWRLGGCTRQVAVPGDRLHRPARIYLRVGRSTPLTCSTLLFALHKSIVFLSTLFFRLSMRLFAENGGCERSLCKCNMYYTTPEGKYQRFEFSF